MFNRPPDYDTADDPIARVTIAEIRKRIAQYYHEEPHESEMRIELMPGRYEPEFYPRKARPSPAIAGLRSSDGAHFDAGPDTETPVDLAAQKTSKPRPALFRWWVTTIVVVCLTLACVFLSRLAWPSALDQLWNPVLKPHRTITFCLPSDAAGSQVAAAAGILSYSLPTEAKDAGSLVNPAAIANHTFLDHEKNAENVVFSDVLATDVVNGIPGSARVLVVEVW